MYINPYKNINNSKGKWLKANFHTHAGTGKDTCGTYEIDKVVTLYKEAEYDVLAISNHDIFFDSAAYQKPHNIVLINGFEYSEHPHMLCINGKELITGTH